MTAGCNMAPPSADKNNAWVKHDVDVTGVDAAFIAAYPPNAGSQYSWTHRNYFVKIPANYDPTKAYPVAIGGSGCGGSETVGSEGGYSVLGTSGTQTQAIQISQSYVASSKVNACTGFADDFTNSPEPQYIHALIQDVEAHYCVDKSKIFLNGYSSGAWQATLSGCTNSDELRGYAVQIGGGLRLKRPACKPNKTAAIYIVGTQDTANPIGPLATPNDDSYGSAPSRDDILMRNGCTGTATAQWDTAYPACLKYTGCPAAYPVVWCPIPTGHNPAPGDAMVNMYRYDAIWKFWSTLPAAN
jgi:predicted peptidase